MSLDSRLRKLEQAAGRTYVRGKCPGRWPIVVVAYIDGEPYVNGERISSVPRCPLCGESHVIEVEVVNKRPTERVTRSE